jgi:Tfp pilus assembly protein PilF
MAAYPEADPMSMIENFQKMLAAGQDSALLRYGLGTAYQKAGDAEQARTHLAEAVRQDPEYSAAWKAYGKVLMELGLDEQAVGAFQTGIEVAEKKGDIQAAKEMKVFVKRVVRKAGD